VVEVVYELLLNGIVIDLSKRERLGLLLFKPRASERASDYCLLKLRIFPLLLEQQQQQDTGNNSVCLRAVIKSGVA
jgi:hypothetical protein